jgi:FixJ family two-component response regulator
VRATAFIVDNDRSSRIRIHHRLVQLGLDCRPFLDGNDFVAELPHLGAGILLIDIQNAGCNGFEVIEAVARNSWSCPIIAMTEYADVHIAVATMRRGATDFLVKPIKDEELEAAITGTLGILKRRRLVLDQTEADRRQLALLTARERGVLEMMAEGLGSKQIADKLELAVRTVESHRAAITEKLDVLNSSAAVALFARYQASLQAYEARIEVAAGR